jgi:alpha-glucosidase
MQRVILVLLALVMPAGSFALQVHSPDTRIVVIVDMDDSGMPHYKVRYRDLEVIGVSRLGLRFANHIALESGFSILRAERYGTNEAWRQPWGERRLVRDHYNELLVTLRAESPDRQYNLRIRVYDDGLGFRYEVPDQRYYRDVEIVDEMTEFRISPDATAWWIPGRGWNRYEFLYRETPVRDIVMAHTPMTVKPDGGPYISVHEAALVDYAAFVLDQRRDGVLKTNLTPWADGIRVRTRTPFTTPWRTLQVSPDAIGLLNSNLILNLNEPNMLGDVSWVEPGKYVGIWWGMHLGKKTWGSGADHGATTAETRRYIDFASILI